MSWDNFGLVIYERCGFFVRFVELAKVNSGFYSVLVGVGEDM